VAVELEVLPATPEHITTVANLFELYAYDFSDFRDLELGDDGRFGDIELPLYWSEPDRHAFLFKVRQKPAGFALVKTGSEITGDDSVRDMAEFFIVRRYRRQGLGTAAAREIWNRFTGPWEVRVMESNHPAQRFWARAIATALNQPVSPVQAEAAGRRWYVFSFDSISAH
jgi:predicted acetyltransferase